MFPGICEQVGNVLDGLGVLQEFQVLGAFSLVVLEEIPGALSNIQMSFMEPQGP